MPPLPCPAIALAYCRPKMMRRIVNFLGQLKVDQIHFFRSFLTDRNYETSSFYTVEGCRGAYQEGLSQIRSAHSVEVHFHKHLKPFVEDVLLCTFEPQDVLVAEPKAPVWNPSKPETRTKIVIFGPEKGFTQKEISLWSEIGVRQSSFCENHLRLESAVPFVMGKLS